MTHYYYIASDKKLGLGNGTLDFVPTDYSIPGFDYPVQLEVLSLEKTGSLWLYCNIYEITLHHIKNVLYKLLIY